jgi:hypothetical protein
MSTDAEGGESTILDLDLARVIWLERVMGADVYEIAHKLSLTPKKVRVQLEHYHQERVRQPTESKLFYRDLTLSRCERLMHTHLPLALRLEADAGEEQINCSLHTSALVLAVLKFELELLKALDSGEAPASQQQSLEWLRAQLGHIDKMVSEAPRDTLSLPANGSEPEPSAAPEAPTNGAQPEPSAAPDIVYTPEPNEFVFGLPELDNSEPPRPAAPTEPPVRPEAERRRESARERFFRGECDAL